MSIKPSTLVSRWDDIVKARGLAPLNGELASALKVVERYGGHVGGAVAGAHAGLAKADKALSELQAVTKSLPRQGKLVTAEFKKLESLVGSLKEMEEKILQKEAELKNDKKNRELKKEIDGLIKAYKTTEKLAFATEKSINALNDAMSAHQNAALDAAQAALDALRNIS